MKVLIIEDEQLAAKKLIRLLSEMDSTIEVVEIIESVEKAINWFQTNEHPDLIFMDIQLEDGLSFEIFEQCKLNTPIIFTTAYDEFTLKAFKVNSIDYLLKPVKLEELHHALNKYNHIHNGFNLIKLEETLEQLIPKQKERFLIKVGEHYKSIEISSINCFYIKERCNFINVGNGNNYAIDYSLDKVEKIIDSKMFFRINRNMIINYSSIRDILVYSSNRLKITLANWTEKEDILISRERVAEFKKWMDK